LEISAGGEIPHHPEAYTLGPVIADGRLFEGTGLKGRSSQREIDLKTGDVLQLRPLGDRHFGEGVAVFGNRIYQLTWQSSTCFVYELETFQLVGTLNCAAEGWGLR
jgi:glutamine cyclotransferase